LFHLLCHDRENIQYLDHDLHEYIRQFGVHRSSRISLKAFEEAFHALKNVEEHIVARAHVLCHLSNLVKACTTMNYGDTDREENTDTSKDWLCRWERLEIIKGQNARQWSQIQFLRHTRLTPSPRAAEIA
jgi:hypothetical protein